MWASATESGPPETAHNTRVFGDAHACMLSCTRCGRFISLFNEITGVSREDAGPGLQIRGGVVDRGCRFTEAGRDELQFPRIKRDVAGRIDARKVRFHLGRYHDVVTVHLEAPFRDRADAGFKSQTGQDAVGRYDFLGFGFGVYE